MNDTAYTLVRQDWLEHERGWGCRPDGYTLHQTNEKLAEFVKEYWARMPRVAPDEYSAPNGSPTVVSVTKAVYDEVVASKNGCWFS